MAKSSTFFVLFSAPTTLADVGIALKKAGLEPQETGLGTLEVTQDGVAFEVGLSEDPHVLTESQGLASRHKAPQLGRMNRRLEIHVEDIDAALDEFNTLALTQQALLDLTNGVAWLQWNDSIL